MNDLRDMTDSQLLDYLKEKELIKRAQEFTVDGFKAYFELTHGGLVVLPHLMPIVEKIFECYTEKNQMALEVFRGGAKTTTVTIGFTTFYIGHHPDTTNVLIQVGDDIAKDNAKEIADTIEFNSGFKAVFPHIVPDKNRGWSQSGYYVQNTSMDYGEWVKLTSKTKDPTVVGMGYASRGIIGKRATGLLIFDDIHDENNTRSHRELENTWQTVIKTIMPLAVPNQTLKIMIGTPWLDDDVLRRLMKSGQYEVVSVPAVKNGKYAWPERFGEDELEKVKLEIGDISYAQMYLLDLSKANEMGLKRSLLDPRYPNTPETEFLLREKRVIIGVDHASTLEDNLKRKKNYDPDYMTIAVIALMDDGTAVLIDGLRKNKITAAEAEVLFWNFVSKYHERIDLIGVEAVGKGEMFYDRISTSPQRVYRMLPFNPGRTAKGVRFEKVLGKVFRTNRLKILDDPENDFLEAFEEEFVKYPLASHDDTLDAVYWAVFAAQGHLKMSQEEVYGNTVGVVKKRKRRRKSRNAQAIGALANVGRK